METIIRILPNITQTSSAFIRTKRNSAGCAISRMKGHWFYLIHCFADSEKLEKQLKKLREPWEYETVVNQIFTLPLI